MNNYKTILLYSKFSNICLSLRSTLKECPINIEEQINLEYVCIDNPVIRNLILKNNNLNIKYVPCLITVSEKQKQVFQGQQVVNWFEQIVRKEMEKLPSLPPRDVNNTTNKKKKTTSVSELFDSDETENESNIDNDIIFNIQEKEENVEKEGKEGKEETKSTAMSMALKMQKERDVMMNNTSKNEL